MKYLLLLGSALVLCISLGDCLQCYSCSISKDRCIKNAVNCTGVNETCFYKVGPAGGFSFYSAGCIAPSACSQKFEETVLGFNVSLKTTCCKVDLCNGSSHVKSSLLLGFALVSFWFAQFL